MAVTTLARQYCGQVGKVENCQVGVYGALAWGDKATLPYTRLFVLSSSRGSGPMIRSGAGGAGIPEEIWKMPRKMFGLALEIVIQAVEEGIRFNWVSADGAYGENAFLLPLDDAGFRFMVDVHCDHLVWFEPPAAEASRRWLVDAWVAEQPGQRLAGGHHATGHARSDPLRSAARPRVDRCGTQGSTAALASARKAGDRHSTQDQVHVEQRSGGHTAGTVVVHPGAALLGRARAAGRQEPLRTR
jgi:hypothetical protein